MHQKRTSDWELIRRTVTSGQAADVEARLAEEAADQRARAAEIRREKRLAKIKFMEDMDDRTEVKFWDKIL